ncbi:MAG: SGNH/GDSL hydrolase family protein, partial [Ktedonobacterales bacterium]
FSNAAIESMAAAGVAFACQFDAASFGGYGRLDMFDVASSQPKPQYYALAKLIQLYRPKALATAPAAPVVATGELISRGAPVYCSANDTGPAGPGAIVDGHYGNWAFWNAKQDTLPSWCAVHLGSGPSRVLLVWEMDFATDYISNYGSMPCDYSVAVSGDSTNGADGTWQTIVSVQGNQTRVREHLLPFTGKSWVKMTVTKGQADVPDITVNKIDVYDASTSLSDTYIFSGDSISIMAFNRFDVHQPSFAQDVHSAFPHLFPATLDAGMGGWNSGGAVQSISQWLPLNPDIHYWLLGWGSNDSLQDVSPADFGAALQQVVAKIKAAGHVPILARIPYSTFHNVPGLDAEIQRLNAVIGQVTAANGLITGPDLYTLFKNNPSYLGPDGLHPTDSGAVAINQAWFEVLQPYLS